MKVMGEVVQGVQVYDVSGVLSKVQWLQAREHVLLWAWRYGYISV